MRRALLLRHRRRGRAATSSRSSRRSAFFEALGADGFAALERVCGYARSAGLLVIADGKRGDIGSTARAYAAAYLEPRGEEPPLADALTVNTYLGGDSVEPFLQACRLHGAGIFCLVRTSNSGAGDVQELTLSDGPPRVAARRGARRRVGRGPRRRARPLERRRRRRRDRAAGGRRGRKLLPAVRLAAAGRRRAGRDAGRRRARLHERARQCARDGIALRHLRLPRRRTTTGAPRPAPRRHGSGPRSGRSPAGDARPASSRGTRRPPPSSLAATVAILLVRAGARQTATQPRRRPRPRRPRRRRPAPGRDRYAPTTTHVPADAEFYEIQAGDTLAVDRRQLRHDRRAAARCSTRTSTPSR